MLLAKKFWFLCKSLCVCVCVSVEPVLCVGSRVSAVSANEKYNVCLFIHLLLTNNNNNLQQKGVVFPPPTCRVESTLTSTNCVVYKQEYV